MAIGEDMSKSILMHPLPPELHHAVSWVDDSAWLWRVSGVGCKRGRFGQDLQQAHNAIQAQGDFGTPA
eukprot:1151484-Pelagomonas_calceolata.AAC.8